MQERPIEAILGLIHGLQGQIEATKRKVLAELFLSSFAILAIANWSSSFAFLRTPYLIIPFMLNVMMWTLWAMRLYVRLFRTFLRTMESSDNDPIGTVYRKYDQMQYILYREQRLETLIDLLTALVFISLLFASTSTFIQW